MQKGKTTSKSVSMEIHADAKDAGIPLCSYGSLCRSMYFQGDIHYAFVVTHTAVHSFYYWQEIAPVTIERDALTQPSLAKKDASRSAAEV